MRAFCVSEVFDDLLMWAHYAGHHSGVVIELRYQADGETLEGAQPIRYQDTIPLIAETPNEWVDQLFGITERRNLVFDDLVFTKSTHWSYERE